MRQFFTNEIRQTPNELRPATINWDVQLPLGVSITSSTYIADSTDYTINDESITSRTATFWLTGGVAGQQYVITNQIMTSDGETLEASVPFVCQKYNYIGTTSC